MSNPQRLPGLLSAGPLITQHGDIETRSEVDLHGFVDLFRRLHLPGYETARGRFGNPDLHLAMSDANEIYPYTQRVLEQIAAGDY